MCSWTIPSDSVPGFIASWRKENCNENPPYHRALQEFSTSDRQFESRVRGIHSGRESCDVGAPVMVRGLRDSDQSLGLLP